MLEIINSISRSFSLFGLDITYYAVFILTGIGVASFVGIREAKRIGIDKDILVDGILITIPLSILGARMYYVIFEFDQFGFNILKILGISSDGIGMAGLAIHGGIITAFSFAYYYCKKKELNFLKVFDIMAVGFLIAQVFGRWGNFINQEAHGPRTTYDFLKNTLKLPSFIVNQMKIGAYYYHPTFLYESIWNLIGFIIIIIIRRTKLVEMGDLIFLYLIWYGIGRFFIELLRTDSLRIFGIKINVLISILFFACGTIGLIIKRIKFKQTKYIDLIDEKERMII